MFYYILGTVLSVVLLGITFLFVVISGVAKAMEDAHKDGYENPFE
jgi:hypothetical protein